MQEKDPIELLMKEHEVGLTYLEKLNSAILNIEQSGFSPEQFLEVADAIQFIDTIVRSHKEKEEKHIFPLLEKHIVAPERFMVEEHRELWSVVKSIRGCIEDIEEGRIYATTMKELIQFSKQLYNLLKNHIAKENQILYPMVRKLLTPEEYGFVTQHIVGVTT